jgi:CheY-like chemotaxis protein
MRPIEILALVDDDDTFIFITKKVIEKNSDIKEIKTFSNGLDALNFLKENINDAYKLPEIIFLDLSMPIMDGWQFLDGFVNIPSPNAKKIIIYICSSSISPYDVDRAKKISAVKDYIVKPITKDKLIEIIHNL